MKRILLFVPLLLLVFNNTWANNKTGKPRTTLSADFAASVLSGCLPLATDFTDNSTFNVGDPIVNWSWNFGDGSPVVTGVQNPSHTYTIEGQFDVTLTVTTASNATSTVTKTAYVEAGNLYQPDLGPDQNICGANTFIFDQSGNGADESWYTWYDGTGTAIWSGTSWLLVTTSDTYTVEINNKGCKGTDQIVITAAPPVTADWSYNVVNNCTNVQVQFTDNSSSCSGAATFTYKWFFGDGSPFSTLQNPMHTYTTGGNYTVQLNIDDGMGNTDSKTVTINLPNPNGTPTVNLGPDQHLCSGSSTQLDAGLEPGATYSWSPTTGLDNPNVYNPNASPTTTTTYTVTKTKCGITVTDDIQIIVDPAITMDFVADKTSGCAPLSVTFTDNSYSCADFITNWSWDFGDGNTSTLSQPTHVYAVPGNYTVTLSVTSLGGATATLSKPNYISVGSAPIVNLGNDTALCIGSTLLLDAGNPGATYLWNPGGATTQTLLVTGFVPTVYTVQVTKGGCTASDNIKVDLKPAATPNFTYTVLSTCTPIGVQFNDQSTVCTGSIAGWAWDFGDGTTSTAQNPLHNYATGGTYNVSLTITPTSGVPSTTTKSISISGSGGVSVNLGNDTAICLGTSIILDAGNAGSTFAWSTGASSQTISVSFPGKYWVNVTNGGCSGSDTINVTVKPAAVVNFSYSVVSPCIPISVQFNDLTTVCTGSIKSWSWDFGDGNTSTSQNPLHNYAGGGTYSVTLTVVTSTGVTSSSTKSITISGSGLTVNLGPDQTICSGSSVTLDAGITGATYLWSTGATTQTISVNTTGTYSVTVTQGGCSGNDAVNITVNPNPVVNLGPDQTICSGSSVTLDAGNAGATYLWSTGATTQTILVNTSGSYSVTVTKGGCSGSDGVNVTVNPSPVVNLGPDKTICSGSSVTLDAGNIGATYLWSTGATTQTIVVNTAGTYSVTVTQGGCSASDAINVAVNAGPTVNLGPDVGICTGSSVTLDAGNPGATYLWNTGATTRKIIANATGTYSVTVTVGGCSASDAVNVTVNAPPVVNLGPDVAICNGNTVTLDAGNAGATYLWNTGATTQQITVGTSGTYSVTVTQGGCSANDGINVTVTSPFVVNLGPDASICSGSSMTLDAGIGGATYLWSTGATTKKITVNTSGTYSVTVTKGGCSASDAIDITVNPGPTVNLGPDATICSGSSMTLDAGNAGATYLWNTGATTQTISVNTAGTYSVQVTQGGCTASDAINITTGGSLVVNLGNDTAICLGSTLVLDAGNAGSTYLWSPGGATTQTLTVTGFAPTVYTVTVTNGGCTGTDNIKVDLKPAATPQFTYVITPSCAPVSVQFTDASTVCTGSISGWLWDFGDGTTSTLQNPMHSYASNGTYTVSLTITPTSGLPSTTSSSVVVNGGGITVNLGNDTTLCLGSTMTLDAGNAGATYLWQNGMTTQTILASFPGKYWVDVTKGGCTGTDTIKISVKFPLAVNFGIDSSMAACAPANIKFSDSTNVTCGQSISSWTWDFGDGNTSNQQNPTHTYLSGGSYAVKLTVMTNMGISTSMTKTVNIGSGSFVVNLGGDTTICRGSSVQLDAGNPGATYSWSPSSGLSDPSIQNPIANPYNTTTYIVSVAKCGSTINDTITVNVNDYSAAVITQSGNELIATDEVFYQWYKDGQLIPGATGKVHKPKGYGSYKVSVVSKSGCAGESAPYFYLPDVGHYLGDIRCKVSPNPAHGQVYLIFSKLPPNPVKVTVFDRVGRRLFTVSAANNVNELHMTSYAKGQYFVECVLDDKRTILPLITQ